MVSLLQSVKRKISELNTRDLLAPIKAVEASGRLEVASRLQQRTTAVMRYAVQNGLIDYNPAQEMAGAIAVAKRTHRPALPFERFSELLERIDNFKGRKLTKLAVKLTLLIFIRSSELRFARWSEIDFENAMWTIPWRTRAIAGGQTFAPWFENANSTSCSFELSGIGCADGNQRDQW